eukprot:CAMPEP_0206221268 /NCGR_PEP_ID=MMETSP0047_2-20121206/5318_1 /ASSEMBLY_ACC=CAM_ASM_000192 /TAXON_ID=195065 /ORGANISM="Chroomonas mesostigmatica_cf, Strain CCMP1168" /LENGTH=196 /DNA_ID=CAMNT_0053643979 /DNA_START=220 /DNA_END=806 /DNA_ORIENTATION=-
MARVYEVCDRPPNGPNNSLDKAPPPDCLSHPAETLDLIFGGAGGPRPRELGEWAALAAADVKELPAGYSTDGLLEQIAARSSRPFYVADLSELVARLLLWRECLPGVRPFFDVAANADGNVLRLLSAAGCGLRCASAKELRHAMAMGVSAGRTLLSAPILQRSTLALAGRGTAQLIAFETKTELDRIAAAAPPAPA